MSTENAWTGDQATHLLAVISQQNPTVDEAEKLNAGYLAHLMQAIKNKTLPPLEVFDRTVGLLPRAPDKITETIVKPNILKFLSLIKLPAVRRFKPANSIKVGVAGIAYLGENFQKVFLSDTNWQEPDSPTANIKSYELLSDSVHGPIRQGLGFGHEISIAHFLKLLSRQSDGRKGFLLTDGWGNIFYIPDAAGTVWAVRAHWHGVGWVVIACLARNPLRWGAGRRVVAR